MKLKSTKATFSESHLNAVILNPEHISVLADKDLLYKDYLINLDYYAENLDENKFASLNTENIYYPFDKDFFVDQSKIKSISFSIYDTLKDVNYNLLIFNWLLREGKFLDSGPGSAALELKSGKYQFFYIPGLDNTKVVHSHLLTADKDSNTLILRDFYNGLGDNVINAPETLSEDIEVFKNPYLKVFFPSETDDKIIRGRFKDGFEGGVTLLGISDKLTLSYPTKDSIIKEVVNGVGAWNWRIPCLNAICPLLGEYKISWELDDVFKDRKLEYYTRNYFDGKKFKTYFIRGDSNIDGKVDLSDAVHTLNVLFKGQGEFSCDDAADANDDGVIDVSDAVFTLIFLFRGDVTLPRPYPLEGWDLSEDSLSCERSPLSLDLESGLVSYYSFDNADIKDSSGNGNDGFVSLGKGSFVEGKQGKAFGFDGIDDFAFIPPSASLDGMEELTISAWVKMEDLSRRQVVLTKGLIDDYSYVLDIDNNLFNGKVGSEQGNVEAKYTLSEIGDGRFHHVALVYSRDALSLYVDGVRKDSVEHPLDGKIKATVFPLVFGARGQKGSQGTFDHFKGIIDEVSIYSRALNEREILGLASS